MPAYGNALPTVFINALSQGRLNRFINTEDGAYLLTENGLNLEVE